MREYNTWWGKLNIAWRFVFIGFEIKMPFKLDYCFKKLEMHSIEIISNNSVS